MNNKIKKLLIPTCFLAGVGFILTTSTEQTSALKLVELESIPVIKFETNENTTIGFYFDKIFSFLNEKINIHDENEESLRSVSNQIKSNYNMNLSI